MKATTSVTPGSGVNWFSRLGKNPWIYVLGLAAIVFLIFGGFFFSDGMLLSQDQMTGLDSKVFLRNALLTAHQIPWWFNCRLGGLPTIDALFGDIFYPVTFVFNALVPVHRAIGLKMILHIFLAGLFFFLMLRRGFKVPAPIAFIGGVFYMLNPEFFSHIYPGHDGKMYVIAWVPFMVWQLKVLADAPKLLPAILLGIGIGMSLLTSQIQITYFSLWGLGAYAAFAIVRGFMHKESGKAVRLFVLFACAVVVGLGLGFIQLYPSFMYVRDAFSVRGVDRGFDYAASWSMHWQEFLSLWVPEFGNTLDSYWGPNAFKLNSEYAGAIALLLAVIAVAWKAKPWRIFWAGVAAFAALYGLGAHTPIFTIAYSILPGVKKFRAPSIIMFWFSFSTILLASLFLKDLVAGELSRLTDARKKKRTRGLLIAAALLFAGAIIFSMKDLLSGLLPFIASLDTEKRRIFDDNFSKNFLPMLWLWLVFSIGTIGLIIGVIQGKIKAGLAVVIILFIGFCDLVRVDVQFIKMVSPRPYFYDEPALLPLQAEMATTPFRCFSLPGALSENGEGIHRLEGVGGFHDNELRWYREFRGDQRDRNYFDKLLAFSASGEPYLKPDQLDQGNAFLNIANAKYLLGRNGSDLIAIENKNALGRVSFAANFVVMDSSQIVPALREGGYDYRTTVALFDTPSLKPAEPMNDSQARQLPPLSAEWRRYTPNDRIVKVAAPTAGFLRISEVYYPGWKVTIDGTNAPIYRSDLAWMAVYMPKGVHTVEMKPHSIYMHTAAKVTLVMLILVCAALILLPLVCRGKGSRIQS